MDLIRAYSDKTFPLINGTYYSVEYKDEDDKIKIGKTNECNLCGGYYKYDWGFKPVQDGLYEARVLTEHVKCRRAKNKIDKARAELTEAEYEFFCLKLSACKAK